MAALAAPAVPAGAAIGSRVLGPAPVDTCWPAVPVVPVPVEPAASADVLGLLPPRTDAGSLDPDEHPARLIANMLPASRKRVAVRWEKWRMSSNALRTINL
jgi:hypothetical protein